MTTHYVRYDEPGATERLCRAVCGQLVNPKDHSNTPTCERCKQWLESFEGLQIDDEARP